MPRANVTPDQQFVYVVCPNGHVIFYVGWKGHTKEQAVAATKSTVDVMLYGRGPDAAEIRRTLMEDRRIEAFNPWCDLCKAHRDTWHFEAVEIKDYQKAVREMLEEDRKKREQWEREGRFRRPFEQ